MGFGIVGRKCGMSRVFTDEGASVPVSVIQVESNRITQVKTPEADGYAAVQVTAGKRPASRVTKSLAGHYAKAGSEAGVGLWEFRLDRSGDAELPELGSEISLDQFAAGQRVDVSGISKGKGYAGVIKRWNFSTQDATHGNSLSHRAPGSIGQNQTPGRVFKGKKMAGHMGAERKTIQNLEIVRVDVERNLLLVKGAIPGAPGGHVIVRPAVKA
ncbi:MAG TPA: 50S ribosomal protein L3 [Porticoccaceae bacterium]|nr:50S ribosomal protein L3 [Porticoccaceae bacterium]